EGKEMTMAFTDKFTSFIQELLYSAILDKGIDLVKFITHRGVITRHAPFLKKFTSTIEADSR
ncbi:MAG: hypothetical protein R3211_06760, partial [Balneolaceae bacterium]|nr:hypothetical protein [Balneolaceae bacterium]